MNFQQRLWSFHYWRNFFQICQKCLGTVGHGLGLENEGADGIGDNFSVSFNFFLTIDISAEFCESVIPSKSVSSIEFTEWEAET